MKVRNVSGGMLILTALIWGVWDVYAFAKGTDGTLSVVITDFYYYSPPFAIIMGILIDHWFLPNFKAPKLK